MPRATVDALPEAPPGTRVDALNEASAEPLLEASSEPSTDTSPELSPDASLEALPDASLGALPDASLEALPDTSLGALPGASIGALPGASPDVSLQASLDVSLEASPDASLEALPDTSHQASTDASLEASPDALLEASPTMPPEAPAGTLLEAFPESAPRAFVGASSEAPGTPPGEPSGDPGGNFTPVRIPGTALERTTPQGYDVGMHAQTESGPLGVSVCLERAPAGAPAQLRLQLNAPGVDSLGATLLVEPDGTVRVAALSSTRKDLTQALPPKGEVTGQEAHASLQQELLKARVEMENQVIRAARAERELSMMRAHGLSAALAQVASKLQSLDAALTEATQLKQALADSRAEATVLSVARDGLLEKVERLARQLEEARSTARVLPAEEEADLRMLLDKVSSLTAERDALRGQVTQLREHLNATATRSTAQRASGAPPVPPDGPAAHPPGLRTQSPRTAPTVPGLPVAAQRPPATSPSSPALPGRPPFPPKPR